MRTWLKRMVAGIVSAGTLMGERAPDGGHREPRDEIRMPDIGKTITSLTASAAPRRIQGSSSTADSTTCPTADGRPLTRQAT
ncbi:MAG: hypothetical protein ACLT3W_06430 [Bifidobacterium pseudocatenulatum]